jgi:hypothetical protein
MQQQLVVGPSHAIKLLMHHNAIKLSILIRKNFAITTIQLTHAKFIQAKRNHAINTQMNMIAFTIRMVVCGLVLKQLITVQHQCKVIQMEHVI